MKVTFIYPRFEKFLESIPELDRELVDHFLGNFTTPPSLGIPILAALTPPSWEIELIDDNNGDPVDFNLDTDLVAINSFTPQATRALELADGFRAAGKKVVMGGFWPSTLPGEALKHCDAVNTGDGEPMWQQILADVKASTLKQTYNGGTRFDLSELPIPRRDIFYDKSGYDWNEDIVQVARGCTYKCGMCSIPTHAGHRIRLRPVEKIVEEVKTLKYENVYLADDMLFFPNKRLEKWSHELFEALAPLEKKYFVASTMALRTDDGYLDHIAKCGVDSFYCTLNVDPKSIRALGGDKDLRRELVDLVAKLEDRGIRFFASFGIGRDWDGPELGDSILELCKEANIRTAEFFLFSPYPGSPHWDRLERQGRIITREWRKYNGAHVVAEPLGMKPDDLYSMFVRVWRDFYRDLQGEVVVENLRPDQTESNMEKRRVSVGLIDQNSTPEPEDRRAVVTGLGVLSPIGLDRESLAEAVEKGKSGISKIDSFDTSPFRTDYGGEIKDLDLASRLSEQELNILDDRYLRLGLYGARQALEDAGESWSRDNRPGPRAGIVVGTCNGGLLSAQRQYEFLTGQKEGSLDRKMNLLIRYHTAGKTLAHFLGVTGPVWVISTACSSSTGALGLAQELVQNGVVDVVLAGGMDALCMATMAGFDSIKATSTGTIAPFSNPIGLNLGEGSAFWFVETAKRAKARGRKPVGELLGYSFSADAHHPTAPDPRGEGALKVMRNALERSGVSLDDLGCINLHGTGTEANDRIESKTVSKLLAGKEKPCHSFKSQVGHCLGAAGILEATAGLLAMERGLIPATINHQGARPGCNLDVVPNETRRAEYDRFLSANYAFGGHNAAVVVGRHCEDKPPAKGISSPERCVITGSGSVCSLGLGNDAALFALGEGTVGIRPHNGRLRQPAQSNLGGFVEEFSPKDVDRRLDFKSMNPVSRLATTAARLTLEDAGIRVSPKEGKETGVINGVYVGTSEEDYMMAVIDSGGAQADIASFSSMVPNATGGWVSNALVLKGYSCTVTMGADAGLFALRFAHMAVRGGSTKRVLAGAADELSSRYYLNYDGLGLLHRGDAEKDYRIYPDSRDERVLGEGAAYLMLEQLEAAQNRGADILAEVQGCGQTTDSESFLETESDGGALIEAIDAALQDAGWTRDEVGLITWSPQGNGRDLNVLQTVDAAFNGRKVPVLTSVFNTGLCEAASGSITLSAMLAAWRKGLPLWPQRTGVKEIDERPLPDKPVKILALANSDLGFNLAVAIAPWPREEK